MTYGIISDDTRDYIEERAADLDITGIRLESVHSAECASYLSDDVTGESYICDCSEEPIYSVSIIVDGALDEEFDVRANDREVDIADWIADHLRETIGDRDWDVLVSDMEGNTVYRVSRDD